MITKLREEDLEEATDEEITAAIRTHSPDMSAEGVTAIIGVVRLPPEVRGEVATYLRHQHLFCPQCGATSCIHGYSDE